MIYRLDLPFYFIHKKFLGKDMMCPKFSAPLFVLPTCIFSANFAQLSLKKCATV